MPSPAGSSTATLVLGAGSGIASALRRHLPASTRYVARPARASPGDFVVDDYDAISPDAFAGYGNVINCVGIARGDVALMHRVNAVLPLRLMKSARSVGVTRFVHISSFSVHGSAECVSNATAIAPRGHYGRTKAAGDAALLHASDPRLRPVIVRLPAFVGENFGGKVARLMRWWARIGAMPVPRGPVRRAMISVDGAARALAAAASDDIDGVRYCADPRHFEFREVARAVSARGPRLRCATLPDAAFVALARVAPRIHDSMFRDSLLLPEDNLAVRYGLSSDLFETLGRLAEQRS